jgi:hypothetical protein
MEYIVLNDIIQDQKENIVESQLYVGSLKLKTMEAKKSRVALLTWRHDRSWGEKERKKEKKYEEETEKDKKEREIERDRVKRIKYYVS